MGPTMISGASRHHVALGWVRHDEALTKMAAACWARDRFTDVTIYCEDRILHAHRLVLASMSPLLANLLAEAEGPDTALMLPEVKAEDMRLLLQFIYQGEVVLPPRRTAALLDLAALLCVAGVRGGSNGPTPPSPPRSDSPELDCCDRNESDHVSEDDNMITETSTPVERAESSSGTSAESKDDSSDLKNTSVDEESNTEEVDTEFHEDSSEDRPMNLASKPEIKPNGSVNRPKPCSSSPPDFNLFPSSQSSPRSIRKPFGSTHRLSDNRNTINYYQHPALQGCHPFSLELAVNHHNHQRGRVSRTPEPKWPSQHQFNNADNSDSDVEVTIDIAVDDSDREIDLSLKADINRMRPNSTDEDKMTPSSDLDNSFSSNESVEPLKGRGSGLYLHQKGMAGMLGGHSLADKMLLLPSSAGGSVDPRRTYLEAVLQESLVQQSYTIVLPSHLGGPQLPISADKLEAAGSTLGLHAGAAAALEGNLSKAWNLEKNGAAAAAAELQCLQGLFGTRTGGGDAHYGRHSAQLQCDDDDDDEMMPTNLSKNGHCSSSSSSSLSAKRNGKEGYSCQVCRKVFTSSSNLAVHSMIHSGTKPFKCDLCSWSFRQKAHLQKHMRHIHKVIVAK